MSRYKLTYVAYTQLGKKIHIKKRTNLSKILTMVIPG